MSPRSRALVQAAIGASRVLSQAAHRLDAQAGELIDAEDLGIVAENLEHAAHALAAGAASLGATLGDIRDLAAVHERQSGDVVIRKA